MRVFVLGHRGMLGHVVARWLGEQGLSIATTDARYTGGPADELIAAVAHSDSDWVVNCIARLDPKKASREEVHSSNTLLPLHLKLALRPGQKLLHASTDGVFSGVRGKYRSSDRPDPADEYGLSKAMAESVAEPNRCFVVRTSVIGPNPSRATGLMEWVLSQQGEVNGITNHYWSGMTTLEWAKLCAELIAGTLQPAEPIFHAGIGEPLTKHRLLELIVREWRRPVQVREALAPFPCDRSLVQDSPRKSLDAQLAELRQWLTGFANGKSAPSR